MTREEIEAQTHEKIIGMYDDYHAGKISRDEICIYMWDLLENYVKKRIKLKNRTLGAEFEDLMSAGKVGIMTNIDAYDPHRSMPTSFFTFFIDQYTKDATSQDGITSHYATQIAKIEKILKECGYEDGIKDPNLTNIEISQLTGISLETVKNAREDANRSISSTEVTSENLVEMESSVFPSPEKSVLDKETSEELSVMLSKCSDFDLFLLEKRVLDTPPLSFRKLLELVKSPEIQKRFGDEVPKKVDQVYLEQRVNYTLRRIKNSTGASKSFGVDRASIEIEQASVSDISSAVAEGLLFDDDSDL